MNVKRCMRDRLPLGVSVAVCVLCKGRVCVCGLGSVHLRAVGCDSPMQDGGEGGTEAAGRGRGSELARWTPSTAKLP